MQELEALGKERWIEGRLDSESKLLTPEYHGFSQKLLFKCACGSNFEKTFTKFKNNNQRKCDVPDIDQLKCAIFVELLAIDK